MKSFAMRYGQTNAGLTLLESMIGLAIFAIVIWAAMANYASASGSQYSNQIAIEIQALRTSVRELYASQPSYGSNEMITQIIASNRAPRTMAVANGTITNSFGAAVQVIGNDDSFSLFYPALPRHLCMTTLTGPASSGWVSVSVGSSASSGAPLPSPVSLPVSISGATSLCAQPTNTVVFTGT